MIPITPELIVFGIDVIRRGAQAISEMIDANEKVGALSQAEANRYRKMLASDQATSAYRTDADVAAGASAAPSPTNIPATAVPTPDAAPTAGADSASAGAVFEKQRPLASNG